MRLLTAILFSLCMWSNWSSAQAEAPCISDTEAARQDLELIRLSDLVNSLENSIYLLPVNDNSDDRVVAERLLQKKIAEHLELEASNLSRQLCL